jgi:hypothetical protein
VSCFPLHRHTGIKFSKSPLHSKPARKRRRKTFRPLVPKCSPPPNAKLTRYAADFPFCCPTFPKTPTMKASKTFAGANACRTKFTHNTVPFRAQKNTTSQHSHPSDSPPQTKGRAQLRPRQRRLHEVRALSRNKSVCRFQVPCVLPRVGPLASFLLLLLPWRVGQWLSWERRRVV